ncbi:MAG: hypothetical protein IJ242_14580 [Clostridia bacterium]|nr:hypothetical protein [Clostridia bacterium]
MSEVICEQVIRQETLTQKEFILEVVRIILRLAIAEIVTSALSYLTGMGIVRIAFYVYAIAEVFRFLWRILASDRYVLMNDRLILERRIGETVLGGVSIPLKQILSIREHLAAESTGVSYAHTAHFLRQSETPLRVSAGRILALLSARLAIRVAGNDATKPCGLLLSYHEGGKVKACLFEPDAGMLSALSEMAGERMGLDDRLARPRLKTFAARSLARAFPEIYPHVQPLITPDDIAWADEQQVLRKAEREARKAEKKAIEERRKAAEERQRQARTGRKKGGGKKTAKKDAPAVKEAPQEVQQPELPGMEIPEHPVIVEVEYNPVKTAAGRRRRGIDKDEG